MKLENLTQTVSTRSGVDPEITHKVLDAAFGALRDELAREDKVELQGLGTFIRKQAKKPGKQGKTLFRSWYAAGNKPKKKARRTAEKKTKRKARKTASEGSGP